MTLYAQYVERCVQGEYATRQQPEIAEIASSPSLILHRQRNCTATEQSKRQGFAGSHKAHNVTNLLQIVTFSLLCTINERGGTVD